MADTDDSKIDRPAHVRFVRREIVDGAAQHFDRMDFAMRALRLVRPAGMTVAVFEARSALYSETGRDLRRGPGASWGILGVPPHASREDIAIAVVRMAGRSDDPYVLDVILADDSPKV
jgi:hypothetical protein